MFNKLVTPLTLVGLLAIVANVQADPSATQANRPRVIEPTMSATLQHLRHVPELPDVFYDVRKLERKMLPNRLGSSDNPEAAAVQDGGGSPSAVSPGSSFDGVGSRNSVLPPDTVGAMGLNYYVQMTNLSFAVFDRDGQTVYGPANNNTLWSGLGAGTVCVANNDGDPVVLYDEAANRWLMSQFALPNFPNGPFYECIAVSKTGDPTGGWWLYAYKISDTKMDDYPKFGVWPDGYYMSINQYQCNSGGSCNWAGAGVVAFERQKMLAGDPTARAVYFDLYSVDRNLGGFLPSDWDGPVPPPSGAANTYIQMDDNAWGYSPDQLQLWNFHIDWYDPANSSFTKVGTLSVDAFDSNLCNYSRNCIRQPGGTRVDALSDRLMYRLQYRNFGSAQSPDQSLLTNHTVDVGSDHAAVRWYELRNTGSGWSIRQQGTYSPDGDNRWMGSVAMNGVGDIALGYSVSSTSTYPSVRFTGRLTGDALGQMTQGEGVIVQGGGYQTHSSGRWGDYSAMTVDPVDDCTFWYTQEYYSATSSANWNTRIGSFKFADCGLDRPPVVTLTHPADGAIVKGDVNLAATASDDQGITSVAFYIDDVYLDVGSDSGGVWSLLWATAGYPDGTHTVTAEATDTDGQTRSDSHAVTVSNAPSPTVHVADLDDSSTAAPRGKWNAGVTITVKSSAGSLVSGATVSGTWTDGTTGGASCSTGTDGRCAVTKNNLKSNVPSVTFTVTDISATGAYDPEANTDPDGDSNGTSIIVCKDGCSAPPPPPPASLVHIGDLDGSTSLGKGKRWNATVTITAHDESEAMAAGVTVAGRWSGAASGGGSCATGAGGTCQVSKSNLRGTSATFTVTDITDSLGNSVYDSSANHDPDGDSDGTAVSLTSP